MAVPSSFAWEVKSERRSNIVQGINFVTQLGLVTKVDKCKGWLFAYFGRFSRIIFLDGRYINWTDYIHKCFVVNFNINYLLHLQKRSVLIFILLYLYLLENLEWLCRIYELFSSCQYVKNMYVCFFYQLWICPFYF